MQVINATGSSITQSWKWQTHIAVAAPTWFGHRLNHLPMQLQKGSSHSASGYNWQMLTHSLLAHLTLLSLMVTSHKIESPPNSGLLCQSSVTCSRTRFHTFCCLITQCTVGNSIHHSNLSQLTIRWMHTWLLRQVPVQYDVTKGSSAPLQPPLQVIFPQMGF